MSRWLTMVALLATGCGTGMAGAGGQLPAPQVSALTQDADGSEAVRLSWNQAEVSRASLERTRAAGPDAWLLSTKVLSDRELSLHFAAGFSRAHQGQGPYVVTLTHSPRMGMCDCACCQGTAHELQVMLEIDAEGQSSGRATEVVR
jgi:hypothetical protein